MYKITSGIEMEHLFFPLPNVAKKMLFQSVNKSNYEGFIKACLCLDSVNILSISGHNTPLHYAVMYENFPFVHLLLTSDTIDTNEVNDEGMTPLMIAVKKGSDCVKILLAHASCDKDLKNPLNDKTAFNYALESGNFEIANLLI
ncbi:MAG: ankyrin repeat domain-containing protein [Simkaniaceae bacterium]